MDRKVPILLSFYAVQHSDDTLVFGQLTYSTLKDLSFKDYSRRKTFRTLFSLYRTKPYAGQEIELVFDKGKLPVKTDAHGSFYLTTQVRLERSALQKVNMLSGEEVKLIEGLYSKVVQEIPSPIIVVSDIDDTVLHSFIYRKILKFHTLMFTTMEKRKAVVGMQELLKDFSVDGAACFYLSNSEQNLYPLIYRFLMHNNFPSGPLFLKKMRGLWDVLWNIKFPIRNIHKQQTLEELITFFPDKKFVLLGDNTQSDLPIYLSAAEKFPGHIRSIFIRKVVDQKKDNIIIEKYTDRLKASGTVLYYADRFPLRSAGDVNLPSS